MCGIIGAFNYTDATTLVQNGLSLQKHRGKDAYGMYQEKQIFHQKTCEALQSVVKADVDSSIGHNLHAIVSHVPQPIAITQQSTLVANCEVYNWKQLAEKEGMSSRNDAELLGKLFSACVQNDVVDYEKLDESLSAINGVYACCYWTQNTVFLARDLLGEKPLFYVCNEEDGSLVFASEGKTLVSLGFAAHSITELHPRQFLVYNVQTKKLHVHKRSFFELEDVWSDENAVIISTLKEHIERAVQLRIPDQKIGVLFSGGIDSTLIAFLLQKYNVPFTCYTAAIEQDGLKAAEDLVVSRQIAQKYGFNLVEHTISVDEVATYLPEVTRIIESSNVVKVGVALPFYLCCQKAQADGVKVLFSGLGSEEIFAGYQRHEQSLDKNKECISGLRKMYERDLYRDDVITMAHTIEIRLPFLDTELISYALRIPEELKIQGEVKKLVLRLAAKELGLDEEFANRPKKAAQYGSLFDKAIEKLAKKQGYISKSSYLNTFYEKQNQRLAVLLSTGKDSMYAMQTMIDQNYPVVCAITIKSKNQDSYMYHTPAIELAKLQAEALGIPLLIKETNGEKEKELTDLQQVLNQAIKEQKIEGVVTGALYSTYQRERIETIAEKLGLKVFSPLWHIDQELEMRQLLEKGYEIMFTGVAADGLDKTWLNRPITQMDVDKLVALNNKIGLNIAGEGGEFESLVLYCPLFQTKKLLVERATIEEDGISARLLIASAQLVPK